MRQDMRQRELMLALALVSFSIVAAQQMAGQTSSDGLQLAGASDRSVAPISRNNSPRNKQKQQQQQQDQLTDAASSAVARNLQAVGSSARNQTSARSHHEADRSSSQPKPKQATSRQLHHDEDTRVPIWNIAHMINSIEQVQLALDTGSNGIETDVSFNEHGEPVETYHGFPCDCGRHCHFREDFGRFVRHLAAVTIPRDTSDLFLVLFDLKLSDLKRDEQRRVAGRSLARIIFENLYRPYLDHQLRQSQGAGQFESRSGRESYKFENHAAAPLPVGADGRIWDPPVRVVVSINLARDVELVRAFLDFVEEQQLEVMRHNVGFDVGMNDDVANITRMWDSLQGATRNIWQGDGLTNCANIIRGLERLKKVISVRNDQGPFRKVYYWTADVLYHIRSVLRLGIDAFLTNKPQRVLQVLQEEEFRHKYRLAMAYDNPFEQFWIKPSAWQMSAPSVSEVVETVANLKETSANFVKTIPNGVSAALDKVQKSIASVF